MEWRRRQTEELRDYFNRPDIVNLITKKKTGMGEICIEKIR